MGAFISASLTGKKFLLRVLLSAGIAFGWGLPLLWAQESPVASYRRAFQLLQAHKEIKKEEGRSQDIRFKNFQPQLERLQKAFSQIDKLTKRYDALSASEKQQLPTFRELDALREGIAAQAADVLRKAPYAESHRSVYEKPAYDDLSKRDSLYALRRVLVVQTGAFLAHFTDTRAAAGIRELRRTLLEEFRTLSALRQNGTGRGYRYEENCHDVLETFEPDELEHILPEFYGASFAPDTEANFEKLKQLAAEFNTNPLDFLCRLNLHFRGATPENAALYDAFIRTFAPLPIARVAVQKKAAPALRDEDWEAAEAIFATYQELFPKKRRAFVRVRQLLRRPADNIRLEKLPAPINSELDETHPVVTYNGLYFCRNTSGTGQDVFLSETDAGVRRLPAPLNTHSHEVPQGISPDGTRLVLFGNYGFLPEYRVEMRAFNRNLGNGDLYFVERRGSKWTRIRPFPEPISTKSYEAGLSFSPDGKAVLFASDRESQNPKSPPDRLFFNGREDFDLDLWVSEKDADGNWQAPINLGEVVNTPFAESNPILHPDGRTLYFTSDGHAGLGGVDIFMVRRLDTTSWTRWSQPVNLGKSINSPSDDGFTLNDEGSFAYVSLKQNESYDLFKFEIPKRFQGDPTLERQWIDGSVTQATPQEVRVRFQRLSTGQAEAETTTDRNGNYRVRLPVGRQYLVSVETENSGFSESGRLDLRKKTRQQAALELEPIAAYETERIVSENKKVILRNIFFDFDSDKLRPDSYPELERLADFLEANPTLKVRIEGHTDAKGDDAYNQQLSERRARRVADYLMFLGIPEARVFYIGFGEGQPIAPNETEAGRATNRRVAFSLKKL